MKHQEVSFLITSLGGPILIGYSFDSFALGLGVFLCLWALSLISYMTALEQKEVTAVLLDAQTEKIKELIEDS